MIGKGSKLLEILPLISDNFTKLTDDTLTLSLCSFGMGMICLHSPMARLGSGQGTRILIKTGNK